MLDRLSKLRVPWALLLALMGGFILWQTAQGFPIETNILKLLPDTQTDPLTEQAYRQFETATGRKTVFLIGGPDSKETEAGAELLYQHMVNSNLFEEVSFRVDPEQAEKTYQVYSPHRHSLLSTEQRQALENGHPERLASQALTTLSSPISVGSASLAQDPLFTFMEFLKELQSQGGAFSVDQELLWAQSGDKRYLILIGELQEHAFSMGAQARFKDFYNNARVALDPELELLSAGVIHHATAGTDSARGDISTIGVGSVLGLLLLILGAFRSLQPLLVSAIPIVAGCLTALTLCILAFERVHLFTLVFGSSLIGVSIDYSFHYLAERQSAGPDWDARQGLRNVFPGVTLGLITSLAAYLALAVAPFSGLQQIALFSTAGLAAAYLTVVLWYPVLLKSTTTTQRPLSFRLSQSYVSLWDRTRPKYGLGILTIICLPYVLVHLNSDDDIRSLQSSPEAIMREENLVKEIVGTTSGTQFFVVRGSSEDAVLSTEERLTVLLDDQIQQGHLTRYRAISKVLPSPSRQRQNYSQLRDQILDETSSLSQFLEEMGFEDAVVEQYRLSFQAPNKPTLSVEEWLKSPLRDLYAPLWMGRADSDQFASLLILDGVSDLDALEKLEKKLDNIAFVSRADDISELLRTYRILGSWLVAAAYLSIFFLLLFRYRWTVALSVILPPLVAGIAALAVSLASGFALNLFNTLALVLVLGIGIDYTIFFAEKPSHRATTMHAIFLSATTTILSFGLLALSGTPVISSFGLVVFVGILVSLLLSPLAGI